MIPGSANPLLLKSAAAAGGYQVSRSLRFNSSDSGFLSRTPAVAGNRRTWTWAGWVKRSALGTKQQIFGVTGVTDVDYCENYFGSDDKLYLRYGYNTVGEVVTTQVFRDPSSWYHILFAFDVTQATAANRLRLYVNGVEVTTFSTDTRSTLTNTDWAVNRIATHYISGSPNGGGTSEGVSGYLADIHFIDGQALTPSSFTEVSATTGQLIPKAYTGSYGTNGFQLKFADNSSNTATTLGKDTSGNGNNWTPNNFSVLNSPQRWSRYFSVVGGGSSNVNGTELQAFDSSESTFNGYSGALLPSNYLLWSSPTTFSNAAVRVRVNQGNLGTATLEVNGASRTITNAQGVHWEDFGTLSTFNFIKLGLDSQPSNGTYIYAVEVNGSLLIDSVFNSANDSLVDTPTSYGTDTGVGGEVRGNYATWNPLINSTNLTNGNLSVVQPSTTAGYRSSTIGMPSGKWYWEINIVKYSNTVFGVVKNPVNIVESSDGMGWRTAGGFFTTSGSVAGSLSVTAGDLLGLAFNADTAALSFYKNGSFVITITSSADVGKTWFAASQDSGGGNSDHDVNFGQRAFAYTAPSGFKALCDTNLGAPVVAKPNTVMDVALYNGNGAANTITGLAFSPDLVWMKVRSTAYNHTLIDSVRGATKTLSSSMTVQEYTEPTGPTAFTADGWSMSGDVTYVGSVNASGQTYVAWAWDAGTSTVSNTAGSITSQVRANVSAGFSVVTYTGVTGNQSFGHGLGVNPKLIMIKNRSNSANWFVMVDIGTTYYKYGHLNTTDAFADATAQPVTSTTVTLGNNNAWFGANGDNYVAYCFAPVVGYSSMGSYVGNGSSDGPFVYTGFRPRYLCIKSSSFSDQWLVLDAARNTYNVVNLHLHPNLANNESSLDWLDFTANGFKIRTTYSTVNQSSGSFIYFAFAENPFQYARAR